MKEFIQTSNKHQHLHANPHLTYNQYESFYHSRDKNQLTLHVRKQLKDLGKVLNIQSSFLEKLEEISSIKKSSPR